MSLALSVYHRLPPFSRSLVASARGYYLGWWRYDKRTEKLVEDALERDTWTAENWKAWRDERLAFILDRAATKVPFYQDQWAGRRRNGDKASWEHLENWPVLDKQILRENAAAFVASDRPIRKMFHDHTSGTTGTSLDLWQTSETVKQWYAIFEARSRRWYGLTRRDRWAILGGQLVVPAARQKPPFWVWNAGLRQLYMSSYHLSPQLINHYLDAIAKYRVTYILGYPSALYSLAYEALRQNRTDIRLRVAIANAEPVYEHQREAISAAFNCPVRETYGMAEIAAAASECELGNLHQWPDTGIIEVEPDQPDGTGEFICTGLINADMPLIRYRVGDRGKMSADICGCGRTLPLIGSIDGRTDDVLYTRDGRRVGRLDPIFKDNLPIVEAQIIQESLDLITVKYVPAAGFTPIHADVLRKRLVERLGQIEVAFERVDGIPRTNRGKFRAVICNLPPQQRGAENRISLL
ncbi:MAG TPA: AMP-binding protein [Pyrinomonadaceae bacterium]|jgi:phenylacetate-CoA ligase|nr:AMP-binding protein [Pyrinomonadaceae bacterium]